jgi:hypothetical protein
MASSFVLWDSLRKFDSRSIYKSGSLPRPVIFSSDPLNPTGIHSYATATLTPRASISLTQKAGAKKREVTLTIKDGKGKKTISARSSVRGVFRGGGGSGGEGDRGGGVSREGGGVASGARAQGDLLPQPQQLHSPCRRAHAQAPHHPPRLSRPPNPQARLAKVLAKAPRADLHATLFMRFSRLASTVGKANAQSSARDAPPALVTK